MHFFVLFLCLVLSLYVFYLLVCLLMERKREGRERREGGRKRDRERGGM